MVVLEVNTFVKPTYTAQAIHIFMAYLISNFCNMITIFLLMNLIQTGMLAFFFLIHLIKDS
jgi:hypothetical protein